MCSKIIITIFALIAIAQTQVYYNAPAVAEYAWPAVGESSPYYASAYAGLPVYGYPYAYAIGSGSKGNNAPPPQKPSPSLTNNNRF